MQVALFNLMNMNRPEDTPAGILGATRDVTVLADEVGFDAAWFAEHHFSSQSLCCSPLMMAAHCAAVTRRIKLGPAVLVLPFYDPLRVVQEIAMLDALSGGRTILGFGAGHQPHEFRSFGLDMAQKAAATLDAWDIIEQGLTTCRGRARRHHPPCARNRARHHPRSRRECPSCSSQRATPRCCAGLSRAAQRPSSRRAIAGSMPRSPCADRSRPPSRPRADGVRCRSPCSATCSSRRTAVRRGSPPKACST